MDFQYHETIHLKADNNAGLGIRSFAHCSFAHLLIAHFAQIKWATGSDSLRSLKTNERLWANPSGRSRQMSDREQIAQVALTNKQPWAIRWGRSW